MSFGKRSERLLDDFTAMSAAIENGIKNFLGTGNASSNTQKALSKSNKVFKNKRTATEPNTKILLPKDMKKDEKASFFKIKS